MKKAYPVILSQGKKMVIAYIPAFEINTQGENITDAMEMARDAIGVVGIDMEDEGETLPEPSEVSAIKADSADDIVTLVDVDFGEYRRKNDMRAVRRNVSLPSGLDAAAKEADINVSAVLARALKQELRIAEP